MCCLVVSTAVGHPCLRRREIGNCNSGLLLLLLIVIGHRGLAKLCLLQADAAIHSGGDGQFSALQRHDMWLLAVPFGFGPVLASVLLGRTMAAPSAGAVPLSRGAWAW